jgi:hypothetical protein
LTITVRRLRAIRPHGDGSRLDRGVEAGDVVDALRRKDRHSITLAREPLDARGDGLQSDTQLGPRDFERVSFSAGVVQVAICHGITDICDVALDRRNQRGSRR